MTSAPLTSLPTVEVEPEGEEHSALDLRPDGRIIITFGDDIEVLLRRPTLGQFRHWRVRLTEIGEAATRLAQQTQTELNADRDDKEIDDAERMVRRTKRLTEVQEISEAQSEGWWQEVFEALAEGPVPPVDEWPPFLIFGESVLQDVLQHWRKVPLARGARSNKAS